MLEGDVKLLLYAALLLGGFVALSLMSFWLAFRPPRLTIPLSPADFKLSVEEVSIPTAEGRRLAGWLLPRHGAPAVVMLHGYPAEKADLLPIAAKLRNRFTLLLLDLRYFGRSEGRATTLGLRERDDLRRAIDALAARGFTGFGVFGFSLGGAIAVTTAAEDRRIRAIAVYAPFSDLRELGHELYAWMGPARYPFVALMRLWSRVFLGGDIASPAPVAVAPRLAIPVYLIASRADEQIFFRHAERLRDALAHNARAEFEFLDRGRHGELPADIEERLERFFERSLAAPERAS
jgi:pimeloyl-ACP methyl ester carboxylesterase